DSAGNTVIHFSDGKTVTVPKGRDGQNGRDGHDGVSITVTNTTTDGAGNTVIHFSDGKTVTVPKGQDGHSVSIQEITK
ncbi:hypothetical protein WL575_13030, partial [Staphylococcus warneri]